MDYHNIRNRQLLQTMQYHSYYIGYYLDKARVGQCNGLKPCWSLVENLATKLAATKQSSTKLRANLMTYKSTQERGGHAIEYSSCTSELTQASRGHRQGLCIRTLASRQIALQQFNLVFKSHQPSAAQTLTDTTLLELRKVRNRRQYSK